MRPKPRSSNKKERQSFFVLRLFVCVFSVGFILFFYIEKQNELTELRLAIPALIAEVKNLHEENTRLTYEIERFESPIHLMELMQKPEFSHLKYPLLSEEIFFPPGQELSDPRNGQTLSYGE